MLKVHYYLRDGALIQRLEPGVGHSKQRHLQKTERYLSRAKYCCEGPEGRPQYVEKKGSAGGNNHQRIAR